MNGDLTKWFILMVVWSLAAGGATFALVTAVTARTGVAGFRDQTNVMTGVKLRGFLYWGLRFGAFFFSLPIIGWVVLLNTWLLRVAPWIPPVGVVVLALIVVFRIIVVQQRRARARELQLAHEQMRVMYPAAEVVPQAPIWTASDEQRRAFERSQGY